VPRTSARPPVYEPSQYALGMGDVSIRVLNQKTSKVLVRVKSGEEITVTEHGEVIARIVPAVTGASSTRCSVPAEHSPQLARFRTSAHHFDVPGRPDADALLERMRDEERY
jgi:prevent-host-death family protein